MTLLPVTPKADQIDPSTLTYLCLVDRVAVSSFNQGILTHIGDGHLVVYITSDINADQQVLLLRFYDFYDEEKSAIVLLSRSKAWLQDERTLIFPRAEGGLWRLDCSDSDEASFGELQDVLTYFIRYENRHQMRNTLAMISPVSCQVTQIVGDNVHLDRTESESILDEEDFITSHEDENGQKLPVYVDNDAYQETSDPSKIKKVRLLYTSGNAMVTGSDWIAHALVLAGQALSKGISSGSRMVEDKIEPTSNPVQLSNQERKVFDVVYNTTSTATSMASGLVDMAVSTAVSNINAMVYKDQQMQAREPVQNASRHFGISALQAAVKIAGGIASAASMVLATSRDSVVQMIHKKYGNDAGYMAQKTIGSGVNTAEMLMYFDARGISRRVVLGATNEYSSHQDKMSDKKSDTNEEMAGNQVVFENDDWLHEDGSSSTQNSTKPPTEKSFITV